MTADVQRELAEALAPKRHSWDPDELRDIVTDLLPTVQALIADAEKRAAAAALWEAAKEARCVPAMAGYLRDSVAAWLEDRARAAALDPSGAAEGAGR